MSAQRTKAGERTLASDLQDAARIGGLPDGGVSRFAFTPELAEVTAWVSEELERLGLEPETDAAGSFFARWPAGDGKPVMAASHLDTVPHGGHFDGVLGVLSAVDAVRLLRAEGFEPSRPIVVGAFMDEEGPRFGNGLFGSRAFVGDDMSVALANRDADGVSAADAMRAMGLDPDRIGEANRVADVGAYVELHIEQGPMLDQRGLRLGVVDAITGIYGYRAALHGETNHAGTTPMDLRHDALVGAARVVLELRERARADDRLRATVGRIEALPGAKNIVPGACEFTIDLRPADPDQFEPADAWLRETLDRIAAEEGLTASLHVDYAVPAVPMDPAVVAAIEEAAREQDVEPLRMFSGAGHDAMLVAPHVPAGMIFVPSRRGISHSPEEWTDVADCELGARVLAGTLRRLAS
jgi:hydantoinase/carbamoylase family amidase